MRRVSKKRARLMREVAAKRRAFREEFPECVVCGSPTTEVHEMACGSHREKALAERCTWLPTCTYCNQHKLDGYQEFPIVRQLALKWVLDRESFDLLLFNEIRGRAPTAITMADVIPWICREIDG